MQIWRCDAAGWLQPGVDDTQSATSTLKQNREPLGSLANILRVSKIKILFWISKYYLSKYSISQNIVSELALRFCKSLGFCDSMEIVWY